MLESIAVGRPIITTNVPGCNDLVEHNFNGFLVLPKDSYSLFIYMEKFFLLDIKEKFNFSVFARNLSHKFDEKSVLKNYTEIYSKLSNDI